MLRFQLLVLVLFLPLSLAGCLGFHKGAMPEEPGDASYLDVEGVRVRYLDTGGPGAPVLLIHGFASSLDTWTGVIPVLASKHRVLALDMKGFGWTDRPEGDYSPAAQARLALALMDKLGVQRTAVVAHSWGSSVALSMALLAPERVERIALYDAWVYEAQQPMFFIWARAPGIGEALFAMFYNERAEDRIVLGFYDPERYVTQKLVDLTLKAMARPGTKAAALAVARAQNFQELETSYAKVSQPVLLLWGREDHVSTMEVAELLLRQLPKAELKVYARCGHFPMIEALAESTRDLAVFLAGGGGA
ncbi:MAG: alpha/beta hydrolase [Deltaproteobacteria bacterium]|nr:alpha/beta hydrolase [Deltaproteobacteria bacterium]